MKKSCIKVVLIFLFVLPAAADEFTFTENFSTTTKKDGSTTANWSISAGKTTLPYLLGAEEQPYPAVDWFQGSGPNYNLGYRFKSTVDVCIVSMGRYDAGPPSSALDIRLYTDSGSLVKHVTVPNVAGWQWVTLADPILITAGDYYIIAVHAVDFYTYETPWTFPETRGSIYISGSRYAIGGNFPDGEGGAQMFGGCDIKIKPFLGYDSDSVAQSIAVDSTSSVITSVTLNVTDTIPANTSITYEVTANAGTNWYQFTPTNTFTMPQIGRGSDLRWRANLSNTNLGVTPSLDEIKLDYYTGTIVTTSNWTSLITAGTSVKSGQSVAYVSFQAESAEGTARWKKLRIDKYSPAGKAIIPDDKIEIQIWCDSNNNGAWDVQDIFISRGYFDNGTVKINMKRFQVTTTSKTFYIVYKLSNSIGGGQRAGVEIADNSYLEFEAGTTILGVPP